MPEIKNALSAVHNHALLQFRFPDVGMKAELHRNGVPGLLRRNKLPFSSGAFAVGGVFFSVDRIGVSAERHAENLSAQILERAGKTRFILILPRRKMIRLHRLPVGQTENNRGDLAAFLRDKIFDPRRVDQPAVRIV